MAFQYIYNREYGSLIHYAQGYTKDPETTADCIQDLFVYIWNKKEQLKEVDNIRPYLLVSLRHMLLKSLKKKKSVELKTENESFHDKESSVEDRMIESEYNAEMKGRLQAAYNILSSRQREAVFLRYNEGLEYEDICAVMHINYQSVRNLISTAVKKLSDHLKKNQND